MTLPELLQWLETRADLLLAMSLGSGLMLVASVLLVPWLVIRAPVDVFVRDPSTERGPLAWLLWVLRNLIGGMLLVAGLLMLVLPGQGMLTLVAALCLLDLPRKRVLLRRLVTRPTLWKTLGWIRQRAGKEPLLKP